MRGAIALSAMIAAFAPARSEEIYFRGLGEVFSAGVCGIGSGSCWSFLGVENAIADFCKRRPKPVFVAGHSMGGSAAMRFVHGLSECGMTVDAAAFLDPMAHPYDIPSGMRTVTLYSTFFAGTGEGYSDAHSIGGSHIGMAFSPAVRGIVRDLFDRKAVRK